MGRMRKCCRLQVGGRRREDGERLSEGGTYFACMIMKPWFYILQGFVGMMAEQGFQLRYPARRMQSLPEEFDYVCSLSRFCYAGTQTLGNDPHTCVREIAVLVS